MRYVIRFIHKEHGYIGETTCSDEDFLVMSQLAENLGLAVEMNAMGHGMVEEQTNEKD